jgi:thioredoxin 2
MCEMQCPFGWRRRYAIGERLHDKATQADDLPLIIDYWAPWCGPCRMMAPEFAHAAKTLQAKARFTKIDTEQFPAISQRLQIKGIPLLILYAKSKEVARLAGSRPSADIEAFVRQHL